tara:strand:- start:980 stop:1807 length:828 start_codon:yes stop_codon:yes gene_type:complete
MKIEKFYLDDDTFIRFKKVGNGAPILLLHTFRNRLEYSDKLSKLLEDEFTVYSVDLPGFGDSPINTNTNYNLDFFTKSMVSFIKKLKIKNLTIAGESIGATLAASVSVELPKVVKKIYMFNTYDYDSYFGEGIQRGNFFAKFILFHVGIPVIGNLFSSLENKFILKNIMSGGFFDKTKLPDNYLNLLCTSLKKKGYVYHFRNTLSQFNKNSGIKELYKKVTVPVKLFYGSNDWAKESDKLLTQNLLKLDEFKTINKSSHFSFLENSLEVSKLIKL